MNHLIFDIETGPLPVNQLMIPEFEAPANYKDPVKIAGVIAEKRSQWIDRAALDARSGQILAIGIMRGTDDISTLLASEKVSESMLLKWAWKELMYPGGEHFRRIGFCSNRFDIPFMVRRSWKLGVQVPRVMAGRYLDSSFVDLADLWQCGRREDTISLDELGKFLGLGGKNVDGSKHYHELMSVDPVQADNHLKWDLKLTAACAETMGVI